MRTMTQREKEIFDDLMDLYEFQVYTNEQGKLQVNDLQGACLGDICDEIFKDEFEILERMEIYHLDYIVRVLEDDLNTYFYSIDDCLTYLLALDNKDDYAYDIAVLSLILNKRLDN